MSLDNIEYRIFCITENEWVSAWASSPLTQCPNSASHVVNPNSVQEINSEHDVFITINSQSTLNLSFTLLYSLYYDTSVNGPFRRLQAVANMEGLLSATSFSIQVYDYTNQVVLIESSQTNTVANTVLNIGTTTNASNEGFFLEIYCQADNGLGDTSVNINQLTLSASQL
jgi:hypothetical protein